MVGCRSLTERKGSHFRGGTRYVMILQLNCQVAGRLITYFAADSLSLTARDPYSEDVLWSNFFRRCASHFLLPSSGLQANRVELMFPYKYNFAFAFDKVNVTSHPGPSPLLSPGPSSFLPSPGEEGPGDKAKPFICFCYSQFTTKSWAC